jgi:hypothetical protein
MGHRGGGTERITLLPKDLGFRQADNQILNAIGKIPGELPVGRRNVIQYLALSDTLQPVFYISLVQCCNVAATLSLCARVAYRSREDGH